MVPDPSISFPPFRPHPLVRGGHAQTLYSAFFPGMRGCSGAQQHEIPLPDGDRLILHDDAPAIWKPDAPAILLMHGLAGCHQSGYMQRVAAKAVALGWRAFRLDHRGSGAGAELAAKPYHAGRTSDLLAALQTIHRLCPDAPLAAVGFSLSGNIILKLAATRSAELPEALKTVVAVCPSIDLARASRNIRRRRNRSYDKRFARILWGMADRFERVREQVPHVLQQPKLPTSLYEFDRLVTAPVGGFRDVEHYYAESSAIADLPLIDRPTLILAAQDDPLIPFASFEEAQFSDTTQLLTTPSGGHLGFIGRGGTDPDRRWMDWRVLEWIAAQTE